MTTIKLKNGSGAPTAGDLVTAEPALDLTNKRLYTEDSGGTVIEVGTNPTSVTTGDITATGTATFAGLTTTADVSFGDNDKAIFGAGSDLQIYHDGSNSWINDAGTGNLVISAGDLRIEDKSGNRYIQGSGNTTYLYHTGVVKFATTSTGIDVTGTVTADGLTVDGNVVVNSNNLEVSSTTPNIRLTETDVTDENTQIIQAGGTMRIRSASDNYATATERMRIDHSTGDISFYDSAGSSQDFYWDASSSRLGLGTTLPSSVLETSKSDATTWSTSFSGVPAYTPDAHDLTISNTVDNTTGSFASLFFKAGQTSSGSGINTARIGAIREGALSTSLAFSTRSSSGTLDEAMRIDSSGNVGIGTDSPATSLDVKSAGITQLRLGETTDTYYFDIGRDNTDGLFRITGNQGLGYKFLNHTTEVLRIDSSGRLGLGTTSPNYNLTSYKAGANANYLQVANGSTGPNSANGTLFGVDASGNGVVTVQGSFDYITSVGGAERMRISSAGTLLVGTTDGTPYASNVSGAAFYSSGAITGSVDGLPAMYLNRKTSDGTIADFRKDGTTVGTISVTGSATAYNTSSDQRLKDNIVDAPSASDDIDAIQVRSFDWKADGSHQKYGMVAQELQSVAPEAVSEGETEEDMMGVDYSKLVPMLVKEIQSLRARVAQLEGAN